MLSLLFPGVASLTNNSTKITKPYGAVSGDKFFFLHVSQEGWERRGGKGEGGCGKIFLCCCLSEYHSLVPVLFQKPRFLILVDITAIVYRE